jgi:hypothetical protein
LSWCFCFEAIRTENITHKSTDGCLATASIITGGLGYASGTYHGHPASFASCVAQETQGSGLSARIARGARWTPTSSSPADWVCFNQYLDATMATTHQGSVASMGGRPPMACAARNGMTLFLGPINFWLVFFWRSCKPYPYQHNQQMGVGPLRASPPAWHKRHKAVG